MKSLIYTAAGFMLASVVLAGQAANLEKMSKLRNPAALTEQAPATFNANFDTSKGVFVVTVHRDWAPNGADRFYNLVKNGFYDDVRFFRVIDGFMAQFGIHGNPAVATAWRAANIKDDPVKQSNKRGLSYSRRPVGTRTTRLFINFGDNARSTNRILPFGEVTRDGRGRQDLQRIRRGCAAREGPDRRVQSEGNAYLTKDFPKLDYVKTATIAK
jgi:peptidyl-prolyl cis-trans isomerase A (cyclophilin A)